MSDRSEESSGVGLEVRPALTYTGAGKMETNEIVTTLLIAAAGGTLSLAFAKRYALYESLLYIWLAGLAAYAVFNFGALMGADVAADVLAAELKKVGPLTEKGTAVIAAVRDSADIWGSLLQSLLGALAIFAALFVPMLIEWTESEETANAES